MGVELRVLVAAREVPEPGRDHRLCANARAPSGGGVVAPRLQQLRLHPVEGCAHRLVMGAHHAALAKDEPFERDRLRRRERDVEPGAVLVRAVALAPQPDGGVRDEPREHLLETLRAHMPPKPERRRAAPVPEARAAVLGVVLRVVAVTLEVVHRRLRGAERGDGGDHRPESSVRAGRRRSPAAAGGGASGNRPDANHRRSADRATAVHVAGPTRAQ